MRRIADNERGSALLMTLGLMGMLCLIGILAVDNSTNDVEMSFNQLNAEKATYIAEAGAMRAFAEIQADDTWAAGFSGIAFNDGIYSVVVIDSSADSTLADTILVQSTSLTDGASATIELSLAPDVYHPFRHAMFADDAVDIRNSMTVDSYNSDSGSYAATRTTTDGDVGSNGTIDISNGGFVGGNVTTSLAGGNSIHSGATVTGSISDSAPESTLPEIPASEYTWAESVSQAPTGFTGSYSYNSSTKALLSTGNLELADGVYFFSSIILKNSASLTVAPGANVTIYITGDIEMKNSSEMNPTGNPSDLMILSQGDFVLKNSGDIHATFYSPNGDADLRNSGEFYGSIASETIVAHNSATFHYDRNLGDITFPGTGNVQIVAYRDL